MEEKTQEEEYRIYYPTVWDSERDNKYFPYMCRDNDCLHRAYLEYGDFLQKHMDALQQEMDLLQRRIELHNKITGQISDLIEERIEDYARAAEEMKAQYAETKAPDQSI